VGGAAKFHKKGGNPPRGPKKGLIIINPEGPAFGGPIFGGPSEKGVSRGEGPP